MGGLGHVMCMMDFIEEVTAGEPGKAHWVDYESSARSRYRFQSHFRERADEDSEERTRGFLSCLD